MVVALTSFPIDFLRLPERTILQEMFSQDPLETKDKVHWTQPNIIFNLSIFVIIKFILIAFSISCPIPAGVFTPTFVLGAVFGRLYGFLLRQIFGSVINETAYSIIGAASVTASVTRTISVAMIVFEINGELSYMIPVLLGVLLSYGISNSLCVSIFDVLLDMKDLPYLPAIRIDENYSLKAGNIMDKNLQYLYKDSSLADIAFILFHTQRNSSSRFKSIPVVKSEESKVLLYSVELQSLRKYLFQYYHSIAHTLQGESKEKLNRYFYRIDNISQNDIINKTSANITNLIMNASIDIARQRKKSVNNEMNDSLAIREYNENEISERQNDIENDYSEADKFWETKIDWEHECIEIDRAPFTLLLETPLAKIHFLFTMLNISKLFVIDEGVLVGIITKNEFLRRRKTNGHTDFGATEITLPHEAIRHKVAVSENKEHDFEVFGNHYMEGRQLRRISDARKSSL